MDPYLILDIVVFIGFIVAVIAVGIGMSRDEKDSEAYFLAGRGLSWWLIGFSLIAANISTEQFVGMSGQAADHLGLAIASYEWMAAITLIVVAFFFLPTFLRAGIYTIPEFLEYRFNHAARTVMSLCMMVIYVGVTIAAVIYSGALTLDVLFGDQQVFGLFNINVTTASWVIGILAAIYVVAGGLKACAWADLLQGSALIVGGAIVTWLAFNALGNADPATIGLAPEMASASTIAKFQELNSHKLHMFLPSTDPFVPWTALVLGLWIPNFYYWGLNQYITQRALGAQSLADGQRGIVFAAAMKLIIPFIIVIPGIIAFNLYGDEMRDEATAKTNRPTLEFFESVRSDPSTGKAAFEFDEEFAQLYPDQARQILEFNSTVAAADDVEPATDPEALAQQNALLLGDIRATNRDRVPTEQFVIQTKLIGYQFDSAFALLIRHLVTPGLRGFILAALLGAVISSLAAMLNAASTIFTMDVYRQYISRGASQEHLVLVGRLSVAILAAVGCFVAPYLNDPRFGGVFTYIQEFQGFLSPGVLAVFIFGLFVHRAPRSCGIVGLLISPVAYGLLKLGLPDVAFLNRMAITFGIALGVLTLMTLSKPLREPVKLPVQQKIEMTGSAGAKFWGAVVILATIALYVVFF